MLAKLYVTMASCQTQLDDKGSYVCPDPNGYYNMAIEQADITLKLCNFMEEGYEAYAVFLVQMKGIRGFCPNTQMDPAFSDALMQAHKKGVKILCLDCKVDPDTIVADSFVELLF